MGRPGTFKPGNKGGPGRGKKKPKPAGGIDLLADYEKAYTTAESPGDTPIVKSLRNQCHENPGKFAADYAKLKAGAGERVERSEEPVFGTTGPKEVEIEALAVQLLDEWEKEDAGQV